MAAITWVFHVEDATVEAIMARVEASLTGPALETFLSGPVHEYLIQEIELRFAYEGDNKSGNWLPLADSTNKIRRNLGYAPDTPINIRSGSMLSTLTEQFDTSLVGAGGARLEVPGTVSGEMARKLQTAQMGSPPGANPLAPNASTPSRPVLAIDEADMASVLELMEVYFREAIGIGII